MSSEALQKQREKLGILRYRDKEYAVGLLWLTADADDETFTRYKRNMRD